MDEVGFWKEMGGRIAKRRKELSIKQSDLAKYLKLPRTAITQLENGNRKISTLELTKIAHELLIPVWHLVPKTQPQQKD